MDAAEDFRAFVVHRQRSLLRTSWLLTGDWASAEDLVQTALVRAWPHWGRVVRDGNAEAYVRRILINTSLSWRRRRWNGEVPTSELPEAAAPGTGPELSYVLVQAVRDLPPRQRAVVVLRYFDDMSEVGTAAVLGCAVGTVKSQTAKALTNLRRHPALVDLQLERSTS